MTGQTYVPMKLAIEAMRDNGYKNTVYAIAELIDNAVEAGAREIELLCADEEEYTGQRIVRRLKQIAVLDNGSGMPAEVLEIALQFGNGTRLDRKHQTGIGRFGMGLPAASISQCLKVEVWSWQNGPDTALYTYLDVKEIREGQRTTVPTPSRKELPTQWLAAAQNVGHSGTLVVWSVLDRTLWRKASTVIDHSERVIGRIYRKFIHNSKLRIRMVAFTLDAPQKPFIDKLALPNDPGYLIAPSSCPEPFKNKPMFKPFGDDNEVAFTIKFRNEQHQVLLRMSIAQDEARAKDIAGGTPYGKHAAENTGISIVRAGRELDLDKSLVLQSDPRERWWGIELEFPPGLDDLMGLTNNKQAARNLAEILALDIEALAKANNKTIAQMRAELEEDGDPRVPLIDVTSFIRNQLHVMRETIRNQRIDTRRNLSRHSTDKGAQLATEATKERQSQGNRGASDEGELHSPQERQSELRKELADYGIEESEAEELAASTVKNSLKYVFEEAPLEGDAFFTVRPAGGTIVIVINKRHPAYENLVEVLDNSRPDETSAVDRLKKASVGLWLLLAAWARFEDEQEGIARERLQDARTDWGRMARNFLRDAKTI